MNENLIKIMNENLKKAIDESLSRIDDLVLPRYRYGRGIKKIIGVLICSHDFYDIVLDEFGKFDTDLLGEYIVLKNKIDQKDYDNLARDFENYEKIDWRTIFEARYPDDLIILKGDKEEEWMKKLKIKEEQWAIKEEERYKEREKLSGRSMTVDTIKLESE